MEIWPWMLLCFWIVTLLQFGSPIFLSLLSLSRLKVVVYPVVTIFKQTSFIIKSVICIFTISDLSTLPITMLMKVIYVKMPLSICSPFIDPTGSVLLTKIATWLPVIIQIGATIFILVIYTLLVQNLKTSQKSVQSITPRKESNVTLILQIIALTTFNIICWIPSCAIYLVSMFSDRYPIELALWTTIIATPINSIINPVIFIATTTKKIIISK